MGGVKFALHATRHKPTAENDLGKGHAISVANAIDHYRLILTMAGCLGYV
jgi:hypothetical protein